jgi:DNA-binding MurR/RpiR family transcriptional regulator
MAYLPIKLLGVINTNPVESTNRQIASYVLDNLEKIDFMSAGTLAAACNVSKSSISRFCRELDYEDFYHFQLDAVRYTRNFFDKFDLDATDQDLVGGYLTRVQQNAEHLKQTLDNGVVLRLAEEIDACDRLVLLGNMQSGDIAYIMQHNLFIAGKTAVTAVNPPEQRQLLREAKAGTMVIVFSVSNTFFECLNAPDLLGKLPADVKLALITAHPLRAVPERVNTVINCKVDTSLAGGNLSMEMVANMIALAYQRRVAQRLDREN